MLVLLPSQGCTVDVPSIRRFGGLTAELVGSSSTPTGYNFFLMYGQVFFLAFKLVYLFPF